MSTPLLLLRHASAGKRGEWDGDDTLRPLDEEGHRQAAGLVETLAELRVERIISSPHLRCVQTVQPLAAALGLEIETSAALTEGANAGDTLALVNTGGGAVLCTHGDVIENLLGPKRECKKGAFWELDVADGSLAPVRYVPPSA